jgi:medium-chain acyl-[acyl-carrier-protein] hydrolase
LFRPWADFLPAEIELCPIQLPGRESRLSERPISGVPAIVEALAPALRPYVDKPFAFFGHSLGTLICFELARILRKQGLPGPITLVVAGHRAPQLPDLNPQLHQLPQPAFIQELRRLGGTSEAVLEDPDLMELVMPMLRADFTASETYTYIAEPPLVCPIIVCGGAQDKEVSREELDAWRIHTQGAFIVRMFPGDHFFLNSTRAMVVQTLSQDLLHFLGPGSRGRAP